MGRSNSSSRPSERSIRRPRQCCCSFSTRRSCSRNSSPRRRVAQALHQPGGIAPGRSAAACAAAGHRPSSAIGSGASWRGMCRAHGSAVAAVSPAIRRGRRPARLARYSALSAWAYQSFQSLLRVDQAGADAERGRSAAAGAAASAAAAARGADDVVGEAHALPRGDWARDQQAELVAAQAAGDVVRAGRRERRMLATLCSTRSPTRWPWSSLTCLKRSQSTSSRPSRRQHAVARGSPAGAGEAAAVVQAGELVGADQLLGLVELVRGGAQAVQRGLQVLVAAAQAADQALLVGDHAHDGAAQEVRDQPRVALDQTLEFARAAVPAARRRWRRWRRRCGRGRRSAGRVRRRIRADPGAWPAGRRRSPARPRHCAIDEHRGAERRHGGTAPRPPPRGARGRAAANSVELGGRQHGGSQIRWRPATGSGAVGSPAGRRTHVVATHPTPPLAVVGPSKTERAVTAASIRTGVAVG